MEQIISVITSLLGTLVDFLKPIAASLGLDTYLDSLLGILGLGGEDATEPPPEER